MKCVYGDGEDAVDRAYGQPVCRHHLARCRAISESEHMEWAWKNRRLTSALEVSGDNLQQPIQLRARRKGLRRTEPPDKLAIVMHNESAA
jgi:hypothetical protein